MRIVNGVAVLLLVLACVGIYTIPKFNYESLVTRQTSLEVGFAQFLERAGSRMADAHGLSQKVNELGSHFTELTEMASRTSALIEDLNQRVLNIEGYLPSHKHKIAPDVVRSTADGSETTFECLKRLFDKITLPNELQEKAKKLHPDSLLLQDGFEPFVDHLIAAGIIPEKTSKDIALDKLSNLMRLYKFHKTTLSMLDYDRELHINELVDKYTSSSNYIDVPVGQPVADAIEAIAVGPGVTKIVKLPELNVTRVFNFRAEDHPDLVVEWEAKRENAKLHLLRDVDLLFKSLK